MQQEIMSKFGNRVRARACGVLVADDRILMVKHMGLGRDYLWIPPGGGVEPGSSLEATVQREFLEETGLTVTVGKFLFVNEFIASPLHALEFFFEVNQTGGELVSGHDPELGAGQQIIQEVKFLTHADLMSEGEERVHKRFGSLPSLEAIFRAESFYNYNNNA